MERWRQFSGGRLATGGRLKLFVALTLLFLPLVGEAQQLVMCDPALVTPCTTAPISNTNAGDPAYVAFGKQNNNWDVLSPLFSIPPGAIIGNDGSPNAIQILTTLPFTLLPSAGGTGATSISGLIKGNGTSAFTSALVTDVTSLFGVSCSSSTFLRGDGLCAAPPGGSSSANPSASVGPTAVNGTATTFMTSDSAPGVNLGASYTWTGTHTFNGVLQGSGLSAALASPPAIGNVAAATGAFTTLQAVGTVSGTGFNTLFASPPSIGNVAPGTGAFTALTATTVNGNTVTAGTGTLTIAAGKTLTASNSLTLAGTDGTTQTTPSVSSSLAAVSDLQQFTTSGSFTWNKPTGSPKVTHIGCIGGGASGASGARTASGTSNSGGAAGGGAFYNDLWIATVSLGSTETVTVGAGGASVAGVSSNGAGNSGNNGNASTFGAWLTVGGGFVAAASSGQGGSNTTSTGGAGASGATGASGGGAGTGNAGANGTNGSVGGGAGGGGANGGAGTNGGGTGSGSAPGGGAGGGVSTGPTAQTGGASGVSATAASLAGAAICASGSSGTITNKPFSGGQAGSGGGGCTSATAGAGGAGALGGGGGGGGGAVGQTSGAGGAGGNGACWAETFF